MRALVLATTTALVTAACNGDAPAPGDTDGSIVFTTDTDDTTVQLPTPEEASIILFQMPAYVDRRQDVSALGAVFTETLRGVENLTQCIAYPDTFCVEELPSVPGDYVELGAFWEDLLGDLSTRQVGRDIKLGPYTAPGIVIEESRLKVYFTEALPAEALPQEPLDLEIQDGEWAAFTAPDAIVPPAPLKVDAPDPMTLHTWTGAEPVEFRWTPQPDSGEMYLAVLTPRVRRLYRIEDDGEYDLDLRDFRLRNDEDIVVSLSRWTRSEVEHPDRHKIYLHAQFDQWFVGQWRDVGNRLRIYPPDRCAETLDYEPLEVGSYWGDMRHYTNDINPDCVRANGEEGIIPIEVAPNEAVTVQYKLPRDNAALYFLTDCQDTLTCAAEANAPGNGTVEMATWANEHPTDTALVYLVLDSEAFTGNGQTDIFYLEVSKSGFTKDAFKSTCAEAMLQGPVGPGAYSGNLVFGQNRLDPSDPKHCGITAAGAEGIAQFSLKPGEKLTANVTMPGNNPVLYLLYNCNNTESCFGGRDTRNDEQETLVYTNGSGYSENVFLVLDGVDYTGEYTLDISIQ